MAKDLINGYIGNISKKNFLINFFFHYLPRSEIKIIPEMAKDFKKTICFSGNLSKPEAPCSSIKIFRFRLEFSEQKAQIPVDFFK